MQLPQVMGGVVLVVNLQGIQPGQLKLDGKTSPACIWARSPNGTTRPSPQLNPGVNLPDKAIATVHRSDGSGTNFIFTHYLSSMTRSSRTRSARTPRWNFRAGSAARATRAWPR